MNKIENNYIPFWDPSRNKIMLINKKDCKRFQEINKKLETKCPNFEAKTKEQ